MNAIFMSLLLLVTLAASAQAPDEKAIRNLLHTQTEAWNRGDMDGFMQTYWKSDSLTFIGKSGVTHGWQQTLANYKKGYPDKAAMGTLSFDIIEIKPLSPEYYYVTGKWRLQRAADAPSGHYTLLL
ncbi:MAG TPA: nuclear transport factor 2 family protein, partial [Chitinophagaceae bacterium]|nr:nuclear transport factor 2 family protein [Chitinophagaceae bacterium]